jgi:Cu/Ag efflux protein CusF
MTGAMRRAGLILMICAVLGCRGGGGGREHTFRGEVKQVPTPGNSELFLHHEAIDDWTSRDGEVMGMDSMTMGFAVADGVSLEGVQPGDKVEATLRVDWNAGVPVEITALRELPPDARLEFREARPPRNP